MIGAVHAYNSSNGEAEGGRLWLEASLRSTYWDPAKNTRNERTIWGLAELLKGKTESYDAQCTEAMGT